MKLCHVVAATLNGVIGREGDMPWHLSEDLKFFKKLTLGHPMVVGRKTFESFGRPLPKRDNIVVTRDPFKVKNATVAVKSVEDAIAWVKENRLGEDSIYICGGGEIYKQTLSIVDRIYKTKIFTTLDGDTFYPEIPSDFKLISESSHQGDPKFCWQIFDRISK